MFDKNLDPREGQFIGVAAFFVVVLVCFGALYLIVDNADWIDGTSHQQGVKK